MRQLICRIFIRMAEGRTRICGNEAVSIFRRSRGRRPHCCARLSDGALDYGDCRLYLGYELALLECAVDQRDFAIAVEFSTSQPKSNLGRGGRSFGCKGAVFFGRACCHGFCHLKFVAVFQNPRHEEPCVGLSTTLKEVLHCEFVKMCVRAVCGVA
jgi:hypothetical protein